MSETDSYRFWQGRGRLATACQSRRRRDAQFAETASSRYREDRADAVFQGGGYRIWCAVENSNIALSRGLATVKSAMNLIQACSQASNSDLRPSLYFAANLCLAGQGVPALDG